MFMCCGRSKKSSRSKSRSGKIVVRPKPVEKDKDNKK